MEEHPGPPLSQTMRGRLSASLSDSINLEVVTGFRTNCHLRKHSEKDDEIEPIVEVVSGARIEVSRVLLGREGEGEARQGGD